MSEPRWIIINGWDTFQHRDAWRSRIPAWIKVYTDLHHNDDWLNLTANDRAALIGIWIEYASARGQLPVDTASLSRRLNQRVTMPTLTRLNHAGFITFSASKPASNSASQPTSLEEKREEPPSIKQSPPTSRLPAKTLKALESLVRNTCREYTNDTLQEELEKRGADEITIRRLLQLAAEVRAA